MERNCLYVLLGLLLFSVNASAQRRKSRVRVTVKAPVENPVFTRMLSATAQVLVADSLVMPLSSLRSKVPVNQEEGRIMLFSELFKSRGEGVAYLNELGDKCIFSNVVDTAGHKRLFQTNLIAGEWTPPQELADLDGEKVFTDLDYPYLMPDGLTLYFAAKGGEGLGGYDIYRTRFDAEEGRYLKPENLGLPFNSEADDIMYVVDEQNQLAYFSSNRRQPKDTVCLYTFVPTETRKVLNSDALSPEKLRSMARLERIADTWGEGPERKQALARMRQVAGKQTAEEEAKGDFLFVVNDKRTYTRFADFRHADNRDRMRELLSMQKQTEVLSESLNKARNYYALAPSSERRQLNVEILSSERQYETLQQDIKRLEKIIRNSENQ